MPENLSLYEAVSRCIPRMEIFRFVNGENGGRFEVTWKIIECEYEKKVNTLKNRLHKGQISTQQFRKWAKVFLMMYPPRLCPCSIVSQKEDLKVASDMKLLSPNHQKAILQMDNQIVVKLLRYSLSKEQDELESALFIYHETKIKEYARQYMETRTRGFATMIPVGTSELQQRIKLFYRKFAEVEKIIVQSGNSYFSATTTTSTSIRTHVEDTLDEKKVDWTQLNAEITENQMDDNLNGFQSNGSLFEIRADLDEMQL